MNNITLIVRVAATLLLVPGTLLAAVVELPLNPLLWQRLQYDDITPNLVSANGGSLLIEVDNSASPLIYPLESVITASQLQLQARISGTISLADGAHQEAPEIDDFRLRVGLVYAGDTRMGFMKSLVAPDWLKTVFGMAPPDRGISRVEFYCTWLDARLAGKQNVHLGNKLLRQHFVLKVDSDGVIDQIVPIPTDEPVIAVWLSSDGDGTGSAFAVQIERIRLISDNGQPTAGGSG